MTCNADQKSNYDLVINYMPILISIAIALIGYLQYRVNSHKFRLDLYNRRFSVYEKALAYYQSYYSSDSKVEFIDECACDFIRAYREAKFLFGGDSRVCQQLTVLKETMNFLVQFDRKFKTVPRDPDEYKEWSKQKQSKPELHAIMETLENELLPWIDFKKIGK